MIPRESIHLVQTIHTHFK